MDVTENKKTSFRFLDTAKIDINPLNPRGPNVRENDPRLDSLTESINEFGVLVPLVVMPIAGTDRYRLIDGERRYHAARSSRKREVPAYLIHKDLDNTAIQRHMFQIHMNARAWEPAQQCKAAEDLYRRLITKYGDPDEKTFLQQYAEKSGIDEVKAQNKIWKTITEKFAIETGTDRRDKRKIKDKGRT